MHAMTKEALEKAFAGESMAHMKYLAFAAVAEKEGKPNIARLFRAISYAEQVHAHNHARELGYIGGTADNLVSAKAGEDFEISEMYPVYNNMAEFQKEKGAVRTTHYALEAEKIHSKMYGNAHKLAAQDQDITIGLIGICPVCGHTVEGDVPEKCPVCGTAGKKYVLFN